ncbi:MAG: site-specific DNA-methyltransferase, partial [Gluconacetobacter diazotrophicus]|nr:site-specific DNA-methyltransferase [Gluconacetobacter diazotrophicus]
MMPLDSLGTDPGPLPAPARPLPRRLSVGGHVIHHGDCLKVMRRLPPGSVDVVVTSPPYNLGLRYTSYRDRRAEEDYLAWMVEVATEVKRVMRPDASFFLNITG